MQKPRSYIVAKPLYQRLYALGGVEYLHERYRGFVAEPHAHRQLQVTIPLTGRMRLVVGGQDYLVGPEGVIVLPAEVPHAVTNLDGDLEYLVVTVGPQWLADVFQAWGRPAPPALAPWVVVDPFLWALARQLASEVDQPSAGSEVMLQAGLAQLGVSLARALLATPAPLPERSALILRAVDRILRAYGEDLTVTALAAELAVSPRQLERSFQLAMGISPRRYLIGVRLQAARELLETTDLPVIDVGAEVGFNHASHFIETFRRTFGTTPERYRRQARPSRG